MAYTHAWNSSFEASPADSDDAPEGALRIRNLKEAIRERFASDHYFAIGGTDANHGKHQVVTVLDNGSEPSNPSSGEFVLYNNGGVLQFKDSSGNKYGTPMPPGTKMLFKQSSAPAGWTFTSEDNDRALLNTSTESDGGSTGGSWTISTSSDASGVTINSAASGVTIDASSSGITIDGHALTLMEAPNHNHGGGDHSHRVRTDNDPTASSDTLQEGASGTLKSGFVESSGTILLNEGGGNPHSHGTSNDSHSHSTSNDSHSHGTSNDSHNHTISGWRPQYVKVITCTKD